MDRDAAIAINDALQNDGYDSYIYDDYSGRGMYGATTTGVVINDGGPQDVLAACVNNASDIAEADVDVDGFRTDNMGLGYIIY